MAIAMKTRLFKSPYELQQWVKDAANNVTTIVAITPDNNGAYVLFYLS